MEILFLFLLLKTQQVFKKMLTDGLEWSFIESVTLVY